jgi:hypothetical protein
MLARGVTSPPQSRGHEPVDQGTEQAHDGVQPPSSTFHARSAAATKPDSNGTFAKMHLALFLRPLGLFSAKRKACGRIRVGHW